MGSEAGSPTQGAGGPRAALKGRARLFLGRCSNSELMSFPTKMSFALYLRTLCVSLVSFSTLHILPKLNLSV